MVMLNLAWLAHGFLAQQEDSIMGPVKGFPRERPRELVIRRLQLDDAQIKEYEKDIRRHRGKISTLDREILRHKEELYAQLSSPDPEIRKSLLKTLGHLHVEVEKAHLEHFQAIKSICREEQLPAFDELAKELMRFFRKAGPPPGGPPPGGPPPGGPPHGGPPPLPPGHVR